MTSLIYGLFAVSIPPLIHLLNRKRYDIVDWAAMQFLQVSERTRRKVFLEELLLMLLRMGLIALVVLSLASLTTSLSLFGSLGGRANRDAVFVIDGSASMGYVHEGKSAFDGARERVRATLDEMVPGDSAAVVLARQVAVPVTPGLSIDREGIAAALGTLPPPRGGADWPASLQAALDLLGKSKQARREVIILTDLQRSGWADDRTLERWELLAQKLRADGAKVPALRVINVAEGRPAEPGNVSLLPLRAGRTVAAANREVRFRGTLLVGGTGATPPAKLEIRVDGRPAGEVAQVGTAANGRVPFSFPLRFASPGSHLVSVVAPDDALPADNRQDFAIEVVPAVPVLIVDGDARSGAPRRGSDFLRDALAPARDPQPAFQVKVVSVSEFEPGMLDRPVSLTGQSGPPRVLVFSDVPRLTQPQADAVDAFLSAGGGVLWTLGERSDAAYANGSLFRDGAGWLPAGLAEPVGSPADLKGAVQLRPGSLNHPALEAFREPGPGGLLSAYFPRHWKVRLRDGTPAVPIAGFLDGDPLLVERPFGRGRVILSTVALDSSWRTNLADLGDFPRLAHELGFYLAGGRSPALNLEPGRPLVFRPSGDEPPGQVTIAPPEGPTRGVVATEWPLTDENTRDPGVYTVGTARGQTAYYVVQPDARESELIPLNDTDRQRLEKPLPTLKVLAAGDAVFAADDEPAEERELWWLLMAGVVGLMLTELWFTRSIALRADAGN